MARSVVALLRCARGHLPSPLLLCPFADTYMPHRPCQNKWLGSGLTKGVLLASFFFTRLDSSRNHVGTTAPTWAAQIYCIVPRSAWDMIYDTPSHRERSIWCSLTICLLSSKDLMPISCIALLVLASSGKFLQLVYQALCEWHLPFLVVITSRPEPDIVSGF